MMDILSLENQIKKIDTKAAMKIVEDGFDILQKNETINKLVNRYGSDGFFTYMPLIIDGVAFTKYVTRSGGSTHSAIIVSDLSTGEIKEVFKDDIINWYRTVFVAEYSLRKLINPQDFESIAFIGWKGKIASRLMERIPEYIDSKKVVLISSDSTPEKIEEAMKCEVIISAPRYIDKPFSKKEWIKFNKLVIPIHTRGWHEGIDDAFDNVITDNKKQVASWIRSDAIEMASIGNQLKGNTIVYNYGHVAFDYALYKYIKNNICNGEK